MKKSEIVAIFLGLLIVITTSAPGGFILAGVLIGGAFTSATQRTLREGNEELDNQLSEWNARHDEGEMI